ncbi:dihydrolipoyl dehydrogenase family protein [Engelhardtia mirabilis]|uniref:Mercuric reductase n=1 Tax=Engelhardtia mirabilis TaxID=2528011 RepID=A0A518BHI1_9BACT|nr:Mercuric reductase [Planctomycetes bacterium Pla133]QDV00768.1 Mercuric reductase [Planctomycetes bacterium Pla86]
MSDSNYDLIVIGGGSAGSACAAEAIKCGHERVALVNDGELGGLCILRGCMPTKSMLHAVEPLLEARHADRFGLRFPPAEIDFGAIMERKREQVARFQRAKIAGMQAGGYEIIDGRGRFVGPDAIEVGGRELTAGAFLISTGSRTAVPPIRGLDQVGYLDSDSLMELESAPASLLVLGAGAIGLEFATFFAALGTEVTLVSRSPLIERGEEPDLSEQYRRVVERAGVRVELGMGLEQTRRTADGVEVIAIAPDGGERIFKAEQLLLAAGRVPDYRGLDLEAAQIELDRHGVLRLDEALRTTNPRVFAAGDATGRDLILHTGNAEGRHVARNLRCHSKGEELVPWEEATPVRAIFTHPPYAQAGFTAREAAARGHTVISAQKNLANQGRGIVMGVYPDEGFVKLMADRGSGRIVGCQMLGPRADDLVHVVSTAMHLGGTVDDLIAMPWYHPTLSEVFIELARELRAQMI